MPPKIVVTLHGIRTRGEWQKQVTSHLARHGLVPYHLDYGFFGVLAFLAPWTRARRVRWLETLVGTTQSVLVEGLSGRGHAGNYAPARLASGAAKRGTPTNGVVIGDVVTLHMTHIEDGMLVGETL